MVRTLIEVKIETTNAIRVTRQRYTYVEFEELSEDLRPGDFVTFTLIHGKKQLYQGKFQKVQGLTVHESIELRICEMIEKGSVKKKNGKHLLYLLDQEFQALSHESLPIKSTFSPSKKQELSLFSSFMHGKKRWKLGVGLLLIVCLVGAYFLFSRTDRLSPALPSYDTLIEQKDYQEAFKQYPQKEEALVEQLYKEEAEQELFELYQKGHSTLAYFYYLFLTEQWEKVTEMKEIPQNTTVQGMRGYAYLAQGKIEEAELINQVLNNDTLSDQIKQAKKRMAYEYLRDKDISSAESINKELNDSELEEDIQVAKSIVNLLHKYQEDKENTKLSKEERKEAERNFTLWTSNLNQLGGDLDDTRRTK
ncbi:hypothetical protein A5883_003551 [Enterococcus sp. 5B3_DIV0040]|nr:hypothetical protein A5883_003551 [Enterococcus sp. 5B3_DIV0040]